MSIKEGSKLNAIVPGGHVAPIIPSSFDDAVRFGRLFVSAGLYAPAKKKRKQKRTESGDVQEDDFEAQAAVVIMHGMELGIPPLQALSGITIINGVPCIWGNLVPAILWSNGFELDEEVTGEGDTLSASVTVTRPNGKKITRIYTAAMAKRAGLWDDRPKVKRQVWKNGAQVWEDVANDSPWHCHRERMIQMRARGFACRDGAADVLRGMYLAEEADVDIDRSEWREEAQGPTDGDLVGDLPGFEPKSAPAAIEDRRGEFDEVRLPYPDFIEHQAQEAAVEAQAKAESTVEAKAAPTPAAASSPANGTAKAAKKGRQGKAPPVEAKAPEPEPEIEEESPENIARLIRMKFDAAKTVDELNDVFDAESEIVTELPMKLRTEVNNAYDERYSALEG